MYIYTCTCSGLGSRLYMYTLYVYFHVYSVHVHVHVCVHCICHLYVPYIACFLARNQFSWFSCSSFECKNLEKLIRVDSYSGTPDTRKLNPQIISAIQVRALPPTKNMVARQFLTCTRNNSCSVFSFFILVIYNILLLLTPPPPPPPTRVLPVSHFNHTRLNSCGRLSPPD